MTSPIPTGILFDANNPDFFDVAVETTRRQKARKEGALAEIRKTISEKDIYGPYAASVNKILEEEIANISSGMDVDPASYNDAALRFYKYRSLADQMKEFVGKAAEAYKVDKEVNENVALQAMRKQYVKTGSIDELEANVLGGLDAEKVLLSTPGALKADEVLKNRVAGFGEIVREMSKNSGKMQQLGRGMLGFSQEKIQEAYSNLVEIAPDGTPQIKDVNKLEQQGFMDILLGDDRVKAVVDQSLQKSGAELNDITRKDKLRQMLTPFVSTKVSRVSDMKVTEDPTIAAGLRRQELEIARKRLEAETGKDNPMASALFARVATIAKGNETQAATKQYDDTNRPTNKDAKGRSLGPKLSPAGVKYTAENDSFRGQMLGNLYIGKILFDENGNKYMQTWEVDDKGKRSGNAKLLTFDPIRFMDMLKDDDTREAYQYLITTSGLAGEVPNTTITEMPWNRPAVKPLR